MATLGRAHKEYEQQAAASEYGDFAKISAHGLPAYPEVSPKARLDEHPSREYSQG